MSLVAEMEWATGPELLLRSAFERNTDPTRASVWDDPGFVSLTERWGDFAQVSLLLWRSGVILVAPMASYLDVGTRWTQALRDAYLGIDTVERALAGAARDIARITRA